MQSFVFQDDRSDKEELRSQARTCKYHLWNTHPPATSGDALAKTDPPIDEFTPRLFTVCPGIELAWLPTIFVALTDWKLLDLPMIFLPVTLYRGLAYAAGGVAAFATLERHISDFAWATLLDIRTEIFNRA